MVASQQVPLVFIAFDGKDTGFLDRLVVHLKPFEDNLVLSLWHRGLVAPGANSASEVAARLAQAAVVVVLLSADFLASAERRGLQSALRGAALGARLVPLVVRPCAWSSSEYGSLQVLPRDGQPISGRLAEEASWVEIAGAIAAVVREAPSPPGKPLLSSRKRQYLPGRSPPGALLRAEYGVVPFHGRAREMDELSLWFASSDPVAVRLLSGAGGMGNTRLAIALCEQQSLSGWQAGFVDTDPHFSRDNLLDRVFSSQTPTLLVVDYAETQRPLLIQLLKKALTAPHVVRLLLLARTAGEHWERLRGEGEGVGELLMSPATTRRRLEALAVTPEERLASWMLAVENFGENLGASTDTFPPDELTDNCFERVLLVHMSALCAVEGVPVKGESGILDYVLSREKRFWRGLARAAGLAETLDAALTRALAVLTLGGGAASLAEALTVLSKLTLFQGQPTAVLYSVAHVLHNAYAGSQWIDPVQPDLLGEHLVQEALADGSEELLQLALAGSAR